MKYFFIFLFSSFLIIPISDASVIGKGLVCEIKTGSSTRDYPFYFYFKDKKNIERYDIQGYEILTMIRDYELSGTSKIWIEYFGTLNRETLEAKDGARTFICSVYNSKEHITKKVSDFISEGKSKNKF